MRTKAQIKASAKYNEKTYTRFSVMLKKDLAKQFENYCNKNGLSKNGAITKLIEKELKQNETSAT